MMRRKEQLDGRSNRGQATKTIGEPFATDLHVDAVPDSPEGADWAHAKRRILEMGLTVRAVVAANAPHPHIASVHAEHPEAVMVDFLSAQLARRHLGGKHGHVLHDLDLEIGHDATHEITVAIAGGRYADAYRMASAAWKPGLIRGVRLVTQPALQKVRDLALVLAWDQVAKDGQDGPSTFFFTEMTNASKFPGASVLALKAEIVESRSATKPIG